MVVVEKNVFRINSISPVASQIAIRTHLWVQVGVGLSARTAQLLVVYIYINTLEEWGDFPHVCGSSFLGGRRRRKKVCCCGSGFGFVICQSKLIAFTRRSSSGLQLHVDDDGHCCFIHCAGREFHPERFRLQLALRVSAIVSL